MGTTPPTHAFSDRSEGSFRPPAGSPEEALVLGRYRLVGAIGAGGHGSVWRAYDEKLQRQVAVKAMPRANASADRRAEREARAAARLNHPGIVALYELGEDDRAVYLVSELVEGRTLAELEAEGDVSDRDVAEVGIAICEALGHAHGKGVIHRDVKPQNVLVAADPAAGAGFAKLGDFGVARLISEEPLTATGGVVGTLAYMAPEQAAGGEVTAAADVYALALTLHEGWSGMRPEGPGRPPEQLGAVRRDLPPELTDVIDACLAPRPALRPPLKELRSTLKAAAGRLSDADGLVAPGPLERMGLTLPLRRRPNVPGLPTALPGAPEAEQSRLELAAGRVAAGTLAGLVALGVSSILAPAPPFSPIAAAAGVAVAVVVFPRVGWLVSALGLCVWLAAAGRAGAALLVGLAALLTPLALPRGGLLWSTPVLAPLLGALGLAPAFPAIAGLAPTALRRAGLAAAGLVWLATAEVLGAGRLLHGAPGATGPRIGWEGSALDAAREALWPLVASGMLLWCAAWAVLALLIPLVLRAPGPLARGMAALLWVAASVAVTVGMGELLPLGDPRGAVAGALVGAAGAFAWATLRTDREPFSEPSLP
jgi:hypothetical protein